MKTKRAAKHADDALPAFERAAKNALELAMRTGTACYVLEGGKIVDIAKRARRKRKKTSKV